MDSHENVKTGNSEEKEWELVDGYLKAVSNSTPTDNQSFETVDDPIDDLNSQLVFGSFTHSLQFDDTEESEVLAKYYKQKCKEAKQTTKILTEQIAHLEENLRVFKYDYDQLQDLTCYLEREKEESCRKHGELERRCKELEAKLGDAKQELKKEVAARMQQAESFEQERGRAAETRANLSAELERIQEERREEKRKHADAAKAMTNDLIKAKLQNVQMKMELDSLFKELDQIRKDEGMQGEELESKLSKQAMEIVQLKLEKSLKDEELQQTLRELVTMERQNVTLKGLMNAISADIKSEMGKANQLELQLNQLQENREAEATELRMLREELEKSKSRHDAVALAYNRKLQKLWNHLVELQERNGELMQRVKTLSAEISHASQHGQKRNHTLFGDCSFSVSTTAQQPTGSPSLVITGQSK